MFASTWLINKCAQLYTRTRIISAFLRCFMHSGPSRTAVYSPANNLVSTEVVGKITVSGLSNINLGKIHYMTLSGFIDSALRTCISTKDREIGQYITVTQVIFGTLKCVSLIIDNAHHAYNSRDAEFVALLFMRNSKGVFSTTSPFGRIVHSRTGGRSTMDDTTEEISGLSMDMIRGRVKWTWSIEARSRDVINLTVTNFQVMYSGKACVMDSLLVEEPGRIWGHYCGPKQPWTVVTCGNELKMTIYKYSPESLFVEMLYQITGQLFGECMRIPHEMKTGPGGITSIKPKNPLLPYPITWYILVDILQRIILAIQRAGGIVSVCHGRLGSEIFLASPRETIQDYIVYESIGFHTTAILMHRYGSFHNISITYMVTKNIMKRLAPHCNYAFSDVTIFRLEARGPRRRNIGGNTVAEPLYCLFQIETGDPTEITIEHIQFGIGRSGDCLDSGLYIFDEHHEDLEITRPQLGPLCGDRMEKILQSPHNRVIYTIGPSRGNQQRKMIYIAFYSYTVNESHFEANVATKLGCWGWFQPCMPLNTNPLEREILFPHSKLIYSQKKTPDQAVVVYISVQIFYGDCLVLQNFPVFDTGENILLCVIKINSFETKETGEASNIGIHSEPRWFQDNVTSYLFYNFGREHTCLECKDTLILIGRSFKQQQIEFGANNLTINEPFSILYVPTVLDQTLVFNLVIVVSSWDEVTPWPNAYLDVGSSISKLNLPWTTGYYRLSFQKRHYMLHMRRGYCDAAKFFYIHTPNYRQSRCSLDYFVSQLLDKETVITWHLNGDNRNLVWITGFHDHFTVLINFKVSGNFQFCSNVEESRTVTLWYVLVLKYYLSEAEHLSKTSDKQCIVTIESCRFGKCFHIGSPMLLHKTSWNAMNVSCKAMKKSLPRLSSIEESNWLRSVVNNQDQSDTPKGYTLIYLDLYKDQVRKKQTMLSLFNAKYLSILRKSKL